MNVDISEFESIRCRKCRNKLVDLTKLTLLTAHAEEICPDRFAALCDTDKRLVYLKDDDLPPWIVPKVEKENWTRGKLHCDDCGSKLGSFDFVSDRRCACGTFVSPAVYLIKSQIDFRKAKVPSVAL